MRLARSDHLSRMSVEVLEQRVGEVGPFSTDGEGEAVADGCPRRGPAFISQLSRGNASLTHVLCMPKGGMEIQHGCGPEQTMGQLGAVRLLRAHYSCAASIREQCPQDSGSLRVELVGHTQYRLEREHLWKRGQVSQELHAVLSRERNTRSG